MRVGLVSIPGFHWRRHAFNPGYYERGRQLRAEAYENAPTVSGWLTLDDCAT